MVELHEQRIVENHDSLRPSAWLMTMMMMFNTFVDTQACMRYMLTHITVRRVPIIMRISPIRPCPKLATSAHNFAPCGSAVSKIIILTTVQGPENKDHDMMAAMGKLVSISLQPRNTHSLCTRF